MPSPSRRGLLQGLLQGLGALALLPSAARAVEAPPNILFILDQRQCPGPAARAPHAAFAAEGARLPTALFGKWHLGALPKYGPLKSGYDEFFGNTGGAVDYFTH